jgi:hypothetical protein
MTDVSRRPDESLFNVNPLLSINSYASDKA